MEIVNLLSAMVQNIMGQPAFVYVLALVNMAIFIWETVPQLPSRLIPAISIILGAILYPRFVSYGTVSPDFPNPLIVLITNGAVAGLLSFIAHALIVKFLSSKFGWPHPAATDPSADSKPK